MRCLVVYACLNQRIFKLQQSSTPQHCDALLHLQAGSLSSGALNLAAFQSADLDQLVSHYPPEVRLAIPRRPCG